MHTAADEPESQARLAAFMQGLQELGWAVGRNMRIDYRWSVGDAARLRKDAMELVALGPELILASVGATAPTLQQVSRTVPIVMAQGIDPVGGGYGETPVLARVVTTPRSARACSSVPSSTCEEDQRRRSRAAIRRRCRASRS
jgi:ABC-type uncharacterized transport system substrate-binding protein